MAYPARIKTWVAGDTVSAADLNGEFNIAINALVDGTKDANVSAATAATLAVTGATTLTGNAGTGNITSTGLVTANSLVINLLSTLTGNVTAAAKVTVGTTLNVTQDVNAVANCNVGGNLKLTGTANITADVNAAANVNVGGNAYITGTANITGVANLASNLIVAGSTTLGDAAGDAVTITANTATISSGFATKCANARVRGTQNDTAGVGNVVVSGSNSGTYTMTSSTFANVTNLVVNITTNGRPVFLGLIAGPNGSAAQVYVAAATPFTNATADFQFLHVNTSTTLGETLLYGKDNSDATETQLERSWAASSINTIYTVAAGDHQFTFQAKSSDNADTVGVTNAYLIAYEL